MSEQTVNHVVLGMAGHIDHGKTAIVKALTGTDTDRLKEEKERGMTTDLGFAFLGSDITIIDVPGHEKFVKTMVAGVNTVDCALLVIAADDGVMPQTQEHLEILNLLGVSTGLVAVNKIDLVEPDWVELVIDDVKDLIKGTVLDGAPIVPISAVENKGIDTLKETILTVAKGVRARKDKGIFRLPIDRVFTIKGFGTVIAGTVLSGKVSPEDTVELLPKGVPLRVRGVQVHDKPVKEATIGFRTAINLGRIEKQSIERGDLLAEPGYYKPTFMIDGHFNLLKSWHRELKNRDRVRVHVGTSEVIARISLLDKEVLSPGDEGFVQIHFEKAVVADREDRFVVRSYSPLQTMGGGIILDVHPLKHKRFKKEVLAKLQNLLEGDPNQVVLEHFDRARFIPQTEEELAKSLGITMQELKSRLEKLDKDGKLQHIGKKRLLSTTNYELLSQRVVNCITDFHEKNPLKYAIPAGKLRLMVRAPVDQGVYDEILALHRNEGTIVMEGDQIRMTGHSAQLTPKQEEMKKELEKKYLKEPFNPPSWNEIQALGDKYKVIVEYMVDAGELFPVEKGGYFHKTAVAEAKKRVERYLLKERKEATLTDLKDVLDGIPRRKLVMLLEYFDRIGLTVREGDGRRLK